ncbi:hypothetical protein LLH23_13340 [bacterium]|nr:hypothetical protein [bacterium]
MRRWLLPTAVVASVFSGLSCKPAAQPTGADDNRILALALTHKYEDGGYTVVNGETGTGVTATNDPKELEQTKQYVIKQLRLPGVDVGKLMDAFAAKNRRAVKLTLPSAPEQGYLIDTEGEYGKYFQQDGGGWERWYKEHPKAHGSTTVSLPVWDKESGTVLLYMGTQSHWLAGAGHLIAYKYDGTTLQEIARVMLWIS